MHEIPDWLSFGIDDIHEQRAEHGRPWQEFIRVPNLYADCMGSPRKTRTHRALTIQTRSTTCSREERRSWSKTSAWTSSPDRSSSWPKGRTIDLSTSRRTFPSCSSSRHQEEAPPDLFVRQASSRRNENMTVSSGGSNPPRDEYSCVAARFVRSVSTQASPHPSSRPSAKSARNNFLPRPFL